MKIEMNIPKLLEFAEYDEMYSFAEQLSMMNSNLIVEEITSEVEDVMSEDDEDTYNYFGLAYYRGQKPNKKERKSMILSAAPVKK